MESLTRSCPSLPVLSLSPSSSPSPPSPPKGHLCGEANLRVLKVAQRQRLSSPKAQRWKRHLLALPPSCPRLTEAELS